MTAVITFISVVAVVLIFEVCCQVDIARQRSTSPRP